MFAHGTEQMGIGSLDSRNPTPADGRTRWHVLLEATRNRPGER
jgi:hypothetical protein